MKVLLVKRRKSISLMQDMAKDLFAGRISKNEHPKSAASTM
jgi:hypothetical protein